jgi:hypothetical protein
MNHQRFYEYKDSRHSVSADELLFVLIPEGKVTSYRVIIVLLDTP